MAKSTSADTIEVPDGFRLHTENTSHILLSANDAFLNPVQEFNRDMSVACIRTWSEDVNRERKEKWQKVVEAKAANKSRKKLKGMAYLFLIPNRADGMHR
jgi:tRNA (guanine26-N2/guanine27-N2)-dimethyltransferase